MATAKKNPKIRVIKSNKERSESDASVDDSPLEATDCHEDESMPLGEEEVVTPTYAPTDNSALNEILDKGADAIKERSLDRLAEAVTDITRLTSEIEAELAATKKKLSSQIARLRAVRSDVIQAIEDITHTWVIDHKNGVAYLVLNEHKNRADVAIHVGDIATVNELAKRTRPLSPDDSQQELGL